MNEDPRCCGSGTCIIDTDGRCWCGRQWGGHQTDRVSQAQPEDPGRAAGEQPACLSHGSQP